MIHEKLDRARRAMLSWVQTLMAAVNDHRRFSPPKRTLFAWQLDGSSDPESRLRGHWPQPSPLDGGATRAGDRPGGVKRARSVSAERRMPNRKRSATLASTGAPGIGFVRCQGLVFLAPGCCAGRVWLCRTGLAAARLRTGGQGGLADARGRADAGRAARGGLRRSRIQLVMTLPRSPPSRSSLPAQQPPSRSSHPPYRALPPNAAHRYLPAPFSRQPET